ncbi:MAG: hypothetical protein ACRDKF_04320 [Actinomycetota bacterium]
MSPIVTEALRACDCFTDVRDDPLAPAPDLIAEGAEAAKVAASNWAFDGYPSGYSVRVRDGPRVLDHETPLRQSYLERRMVKVERSPAFEAGVDGLVYATVEADEVSTRSEREPVEMDARFDRG